MVTAKDIGGPAVVEVGTVIPFETCNCALVVEHGTVTLVIFEPRNAPLVDAGSVVNQDISLEGSLCSPNLPRDSDREQNSHHMALHLPGGLAYQKGSYMSQKAPVFQIVLSAGKLLGPSVHRHGKSEILDSGKHRVQHSAQKSFWESWAPRYANFGIHLECVDRPQVVVDEVFGHSLASAPAISW